MGGLLYKSAHTTPVWRIQSVSHHYSSPARTEQSRARHGSAGNQIQNRLVPAGTAQISEMPFRAVPIGTRSLCQTHPALPCRARDCSVPAGLGAVVQYSLNSPNGLCYSPLRGAIRSFLSYDTHSFPDLRRFSSQLFAPALEPVTVGQISEPPPLSISCFQ